jgi:hypothetical protein
VPRACHLPGRLSHTDDRRQCRGAGEAERAPTTLRTEQK